MKRLSAFGLLLSAVLVFPQGYAQNSSDEPAQQPSTAAQASTAAQDGSASSSQASSADQNGSASSSRPASAGQNGSLPNPSTSRQGQLAAERRDQMNDIQPPRLSFFEKSMKWLEEKGILDSGEGAKPRTITPMAGTVESGSGLAAGVGVRTSLFQATAAYSYRGYQQYDVQFGRNLTNSGFFIRPMRFTDLYSTPQYSQYSRSSENQQRGAILYLEARYRDLPQLDYYGPGPDSLKQNQTDFLLQETSFTGVAGYQWNRRVRAALRGGYIIYNVGQGTDTSLRETNLVFNDTSAPGLTQEPDFYMVGPALVLDYRDQPANPHAGVSFATSAARFQPRSGDFAFDNFENDFRAYVPLGSRSRVLAVRMLGSFDVTSGANQVPFYLQQTLGGNVTLRGYPEFRFRDNDLLYGSLEYRWEAASAVEFAVFYDTGEVAPDVSSFSTSSLKNSYGAGVRFKTAHSFLFRIDYGHSREDNVVIVAFSPSF